MPVQLRSPAFKSGRDIPQKYTRQGDNVSSPLEWSGLPEGKKPLAIVVDDPDVRNGVFTHWVLDNLPADHSYLVLHFPRKRSMDDSIRQGRNDAGEIGYEGLTPPLGEVHHYSFRFHALDAFLNVPPGSTKEDVLTSMYQHILDQGLTHP